MQIDEICLQRSMSIYLLALLSFASCAHDAFNNGKYQILFSIIKGRTLFCIAMLQVLWQELVKVLFKCSFYPQSTAAPLKFHLGHWIFRPKDVNCRKLFTPYFWRRMQLVGIFVVFPTNWHIYKYFVSNVHLDYRLDKWSTPATIILSLHFSMSSYETSEPET